MVISTLIILFLIILSWKYCVHILGILPCILILVGTVLSICVICLCLSKIKELFNKYPERIKWLLFVGYSIALFYPVIFETFRRINCGSLQRHSHILITGGVLFVYVCWRLGKMIHDRYVSYKEKYSNSEDFLIWNNNGRKVTFLDFIWSSYEISKESLSWIRTYTTLFCYPLFIVCYIISLSKDWNTLYSAIGIGSICIAVYAIWYAVNTTIRSKNVASVAKKSLMDMIPSANNQNSNDQKWTKE